MIGARVVNENDTDKREIHNARKKRQAKKKNMGPFNRPKTPAVAKNSIGNGKVTEPVVDFRSNAAIST